MQTSTSGFASASFCRIMAIRSLTLAAPGGCCGCLNMRGMKGLWVMPMIDTIWAMGHLLRLVVSCLARWLELCKRPLGFGIILAQRRKDRRRIYSEPLRAWRLG